MTNMEINHCSNEKKATVFYGPKAPLPLRPIQKQHPRQIWDPIPNSWPPNDARRTRCAIPSCTVVGTEVVRTRWKVEEEMEVVKGEEAVEAIRLVLDRRKRGHGLWKRWKGMHVQGTMIFRDGVGDSRGK